MASNQSRKQSSLQMVAESFFQLCLIPLSLALFIHIFALSARELDISLDAETVQALEASTNTSDGKWLAALLFLVLAVLHTLKAFRNREKGKAFFAVSLLQAGAFLIGAALPFVIGFNSSLLSMLSAVYALAMIAGRVLSIAQNHRVRNVLLNLLGILIFLFSTLSFIFTNVLILFLAVLSLIRIIFGRIKLDVLSQIIRKTYAAEIIFGLLLLIVTFSFLLTIIEPSMENIKDALWYCFAIVTTIGFGDLTAVTDVGRVLSVILGVYGIVVVALITSIIVNFYGEMKKDGDEFEEDDTHGA